MYQRTGAKPQLTERQRRAVAALREAATLEAQKDFHGATRLYGSAYRLWPFLETAEGTRMADGNYL